MLPVEPLRTWGLIVRRRQPISIYAMPAPAWSVLLTDEAAAELDAQPADVRAHFERIVELIKSFGIENLRKPHVEHLEGKLWEIRLKGRDGIARALYVTATGRRIVVVRVFC